MGEWVKVARVSEIPEGQVKVVLAKGERLALAHGKGGYFALQDRCTHDDGPLGEGQLVEETLLECPRHGARFDVTTGRAMTLPAVLPVATFPVKVTGEEIFVHI